jgi:hypothetical protein
MRINDIGKMPLGGGGEKPLDRVVRMVRGLAQTTATMEMYCAAPMFRSGEDAMHILRVINNRTALESVRLGKQIDDMIGPLPDFE